MSGSRGLHPDEVLTRQFKDALALVGIRVLDHIIVAGTETVSLAERGFLSGRCSALLCSFIVPSSGAIFLLNPNMVMSADYP